MKEKLKYNIYYGLIFALCVIAPDFLLKKFGVNDMAQFDLLFSAFMIIFGAVLAAIRYKWFFYIVIAIIVTMEMIQLGHICYFGTPISPLDVGKIISYRRSVAETGLSEVLNFYFLPLIMLVCYGTIVFFYNRWYDSFYKNKYAPLLIIAFLSIKPIRAMYRDVRFFFPSPVRTSLHNSINCFSCYMVKLAFCDNQAIKKIDYKPYQLIDHGGVKARNIILVMGETFDSRHMSLYGYGRKTTPSLDSLLQNDSNFMRKKAVAASVTTMVTLPLFFNCIREPVNIDELSQKRFSMFKLAKNRGFKNFFYSAQVSGILYGSTTKYIDDIIVCESTKKITFAMKKDDHLIELFENADIKDKNFFLINPKSLHSPYGEHYKNKPEFKIYPVDDSLDRRQRTINDYDNAMLAHDDWLYRLIKAAKKKLKGPTYIIITGDHGELFGHNGLYGHNHLLPEVTNVPFMVYMIDGDKDILKKLNKKEIYSHYEIANFVIDLLGYGITNPNQDKEGQEFFINGSNLFQPYYIKYKIKNGNEVEYSKPIIE